MTKDHHLSVVMLPWSAFGHLMPFFQLSMALAKSQVHVSFISTPKNIQRLPKIPADLQPFLQFVPIPYPPLESELLPPGAEATVDIPFDKIDQLKVAYDHLQKPIRQFVGRQLPDWLIVDFAAHWVVDIAKEFGVPLVFFSVLSAASHAFFGPPERVLGTNRNHVLRTPESLTSPPDWVTFPSLIANREYEAVKFHKGVFEVNGSGISDSERGGKIISASQVIAIRTCDEFEGEYLEVYKKITGKPVIPTGLLPPEQPPKKAQCEFTTGDEDELTGDVTVAKSQDNHTPPCENSIFDWLDKQNPKSVVFVGFGSECKLSREQVFEIAHGLELSELPYLWALRKPDWADSDADALPLGFVDRTSETGLVFMGWVPQMEILGHSSIGGSLFHSGWGSVIETLQFGHVLVVLPFIIDQPLNARLLVEKGVAVEVKRREDGSFSKDEIAKTLRQAMVEEEGEQLRSKARKAAAVFGDQKLHQDHYIGAFVNYLKNNATRKVILARSPHWGEIFQCSGHATSFRVSSI